VGVEDGWGWYDNEATFAPIEKISFMKTFTSKKLTKVVYYEEPSNTGVMTLLKNWMKKF
jgi:hypothetical protein